MSCLSKARVLGYVMARNEWPLLGLSIVHAFSLGLDQVIVVDHQSNDDTQNGLRTLQNYYGDRLVVFRLDDQNFYQAATTAMTMELVNARSFDWVYVFDADEFLLISKQNSLSACLENIPSQVDAVRYEVCNWVAPNDFNDHDLSDYLRVINRAEPNYFLDVPGAVLSDEIMNGNINFFDVPFGTKLIVRSHHANSISAGSHSVTSLNNLNEFHADNTIIRAGHLPFLSRDRLIHKCHQGQTLNETGLPFEHGWQSQMLNRAQEQQQLKSFWDRHSMPVDGSWQSRECAPITTFDESLKFVLSLAVAQMCKVKELSQLQIESENFLQADVSYKNLDVAVIRCIHEQIDLRAAITADRDVTTAHRDAVVAERDVLVAELQALASECNLLRAELQVAMINHDATVEKLREQIIAVRQRLRVVNNSRSLKFGLSVLWPLRMIKRLFLGTRRRIITASD